MDAAPPLGLSRNRRHATQRSNQKLKTQKSVSVAEQINEGLEDAIRNTNGKIPPKTSTSELPERPPRVDAKELTKFSLGSKMPQAVLVAIPAAPSGQR
jgi:hypothetical protein